MAEKTNSKTYLYIYISICIYGHFLNSAMNNKLAQENTVNFFSKKGGRRVYSLRN